MPPKTEAKFNVGDRVHVTQDYLNTFRKSKITFGTVTGRGRNRGVVLVRADGRTTSTSYSENFWEKVDETQP